MFEELWCWIDVWCINNSSFMVIMLVFLLPNDVWFRLLLMDLSIINNFSFIMFHIGKQLYFYEMLMNGIFILWCIFWICGSIRYCFLHISHMYWLQCYTACISTKQYTANGLGRSNNGAKLLCFFSTQGERYEFI